CRVDREAGRSLPELSRNHGKRAQPTRPATAPAGSRRAGRTDTLDGTSLAAGVCPVLLCAMLRPLPLSRTLPPPWLVVGLAALLAVGLAVAGDWYVAEPPEALAQAEYVGRQACVACHQAQCDAYTGSHHDRAMELATEESVLGDFDDAVLERLGVTTRFFRRDGEHFVNTEGPDGDFRDFRVKYTFGYEPLQQYMVEF